MIFLMCFIKVLYRMFSKKTAFTLFLLSVQFLSQAEVLGRQDLLAHEHQRPSEQRVIHVNEARLCYNCSVIKNSIEAIKNCFQTEPNLRFFHLQSQFAETLHKTCNCNDDHFTQRRLIVTLLRDQLESDWPRVSPAFFQEMRQNNQIIYDRAQQNNALSRLIFRR